MDRRSLVHESLFRRPAPEGGPRRTPARHFQVRGHPTVRNQPLLGQALHQTRRPRRVPYPKEGRRKTPHSRPDDEEAARRGHTHETGGHRQRKASLPGELRRQEPQRTHLEEAPKAYGLLSKKRTVGAMERDEWRRAAWRVTVARSLDARSLIFVEGMGPSLAVEGATDTKVFETYLERVLAPTLCEGQVMVMDNLSAHKGERVRELIEGRGCELLYLPSYSPDLNPIEEAFSKIKGFLRKVEACSREALLEAIGAAI